MSLHFYLWVQIVLAGIAMLGNFILLAKENIPATKQKTRADIVIVLILVIAQGIWAVLLLINQGVAYVQ